MRWFFCTVALIATLSPVSIHAQAAGSIAGADLRYELAQPSVEKNDTLNAFRPGQQSARFPQAPTGLVYRSCPRRATWGPSSSTSPADGS